MILPRATGIRRPNKYKRHALRWIGKCSLVNSDRRPISKKVKGLFLFLEFCYIYKFSLSWWDIWNFFKSSTSDATLLMNFCKYTRRIQIDHQVFVTKSLKNEKFSRTSNFLWHCVKRKKMEKLSTQQDSQPANGLLFGCNLIIPQKILWALE